MLRGKIDYRHAYIDFSQLEVKLPKQGGGVEVVKTCPASMGFAFAAGTTDGPGAFDFKQGDDKVIENSRHLRLFISSCSHIVQLSTIFSFLLSLFFMMFYQGNPFWKLVRNLLKTPDQKQVDCQHPKPILLDTGEMKEPYDWAVGSRIFYMDMWSEA